MTDTKKKYFTTHDLIILIAVADKKWLKKGTWFKINSCTEWRKAQFGLIITFDTNTTHSTYGTIPAKR